VEWDKIFEGDWSGRVVRYLGKLKFESQTGVSIEGTTILAAKEVPENTNYSTHAIGDTGSFKITSKCDPASLIGLQ
jgi:hypothetical protein